MSVYLKKIEYGIFAVFSLFLILIYQNKGFIRISDDPKEFVFYGAMIIVLLLKFISLIFEKKEHTLYKIDTISLFAILWIAYQFLSLLWIQYGFADGLVEISKATVGLLALFLLSKLSSEKILKLIHFFLWAAVAGFALSFIIKRKSSFVIRPIGHISYISDIQLIVYAFSLALLIKSKTTFQKLLYLITLGLNTFGIFYYSRKSSAIAFLFITLSWMVCAFFKRKDFSKHGIHFLKIVLVAIVIFVSMTLGSYSHKPRYWGGNVINRTQVMQKKIENKKLSRVTIYKRTFSAFLKKPVLGWGYGNYKYLNPHFAKPGDREPKLFKKKKRAFLTHPHNIILFHAVEGGAVGIFLYFGFLITLAIQAIRYLKNEKDFTKFGICFGISLGVIGVFGSNLFNTSLTNVGVFWGTTLLMSFVLNAIDQNNEKKIWFKSKSNKFLKSFILAGLIVVSFLAFTRPLSSHIIRSRYSKKILNSFPQTYTILNNLGIHALRKKDYFKARYYFDKALKSYPYVPSLYVKQARVFRATRKYQDYRQTILKGYELFPQHPDLQKYHSHLPR